MLTDYARTEDTLIMCEIQIKAYTYYRYIVEFDDVIIFEDNENLKLPNFLV